MNVSEQALHKLMEKTPDLCAAGLANPELRPQLDIDFQAERRRLEGSYDEFFHCCEWLLDCTPLKHVSFVSPISSDLLSLIEKQSGAPVSNGALVAAVLHLRIPFHPLPGSLNVRIGISQRSPAIVAGAPPPRGKV